MAIFQRQEKMVIYVTCKQKNTAVFTDIISCGKTNILPA